MKKNDKSLASMFRSEGYLLPKSEEEINRFIEENEANFKTPPMIDDPLSIINSKSPLTINLPNISLLANNMENLARAAREGNDLSEETLKKKKEDRDNAEKK